MSRARVTTILLCLAASALVGCTQQLDFGKFSPGSGVTYDGWAPDTTHDAGPPDTLGPAEGGITGCKPRSFSLKQASPSKVYLVVDRSGSMLEKGTGSKVTKWAEMQLAVSEVLKQFQGTVELGLLMYPVNDRCNAGGPQVLLGKSKINAILYELGKATPSGGTPTGSALNNAAQALRDLGSVSASKYIVLVTDGGPNCNYFLSAATACTCTYASAKYCCTSYPNTCYSGHTCLDETRTLKIIKDLHTKEKVSTFVIGLDGTAEYKTLLSEMAKAGGVPLTGGTVSYYPATDLSSLKSAFKTIVGSVISCEIKLDEKPKKPDFVRIFLDGKKVLRDTNKSDGWDYTDSTYLKIKLYGKACEGLQVGKDHKLTATFACEVS